MSVQPLEKLPETPLTIRRALLSVSDKMGLVALAETLHDAGVELISTGGTAKTIRSAGLPVTDVAELTGFEECLDGRVKTLHPAIHAGLLARTSYKPDSEELKRLDIQPIELAVVNLYPFREAIAGNDTSPARATEFIDIGGPTMVRAAAKNFAHVGILTSPDQYEKFTDHFSKNGTLSFQYRKSLARSAFNHTADYDVHIANYFNELTDPGKPEQLNIALPRYQDLRYGENPHQQAGVFGIQENFIDCFHGKQLSYNNYLDVDAALQLISDFQIPKPVCAIFKHTVPCGVASADTLAGAWAKAFSTDTKSPFGGIVVVNKELDLDTAGAIDEIFTEIILAPSFSDEALELLQEKKKRRLVRYNLEEKVGQTREFRSIFGGALSQEPDTGEISFNDFKTASNRKPDEQEIRDLLFAWKVVKHVKSNAIVYVRDEQTIGIGTGQTSRVESSEIAIAHARKEGLSVNGTVIASDAFFPFADGIEAAAEAGATAAIQPGGSIRDEEVIKAADRHNMAMVMTGRRHFRH